MVRSDNQIRNLGYIDGWSNGRADMLEALESIALHWERETGGGYEKMREGARWLRTAIKKVRGGETYDGCEQQGPDPWARIAELEAEVAMSIEPDTVPVYESEWHALHVEIEALHAKLEAASGVISEVRRLERVDHGVAWPDLVHALRLYDEQLGNAKCR